MLRIIQSTPSEGLRILLRMRVVLVVVLAVVALAAHLRFGLVLPKAALAVVFTLFTLWTVASWWRLRKPWLASHLEMFLNLLIDTGLFTVLLYFTGGATNPFVSFYLVSIVIAAAALPLVHVWSMVAVSVTCYSLLMRYYEPLVPSSAAANFFNLHVFGMWVNFLLSATLCAVFVAGIAAMARRHKEALAAAREDALRDERIVALGTLAAGMAHEMNTPLATMSLLAAELADTEPGGDAYRDRIEVLKRQIEVCRSRLAALVESASPEGDAGPRRVRLGRFLDELFASWRIVRPEVELVVERRDSFADREVGEHRVLAQAIANLLNNAADASHRNDSRSVYVALSSTPEALVIDIDDEGPGITAGQLQQAGRAVYSSRRGGLGVGLLLSNASIERFGGEVLLEAREGGGTRTEIRLPFAALSARGNGHARPPAAVAAAS